MCALDFYPAKNSAGQLEMTMNAREPLESNLQVRPIFEAFTLVREEPCQIPKGES